MHDPRRAAAGYPSLSQLTMTVPSRAAVSRDLAILRPRLAQTSRCLQRIDRLGWTATLVFDSYGVRVGLRSDSASLLRRAADRCLPPGAAVRSAAESGGPDVVVDWLFSLHTGARDAGAGARPPLTLYDGASRMAQTSDRESLLDHVDGTVRAAIADASPTHLFVHAGVVAYRGEAILVPGACLAGKTTLVRALLDLGASYYSDDVALVDEDGLVLPYARPLAVRESAHAPQRPVPVESLGVPVGTDALRAGVVALATYRDGAAWQPLELRGGAATLALLRHTGAVQRRPARALALLGRLLHGATVLRGVRGEATACARALLGAIDARAGVRDAA